MKKNKTYRNWIQRSCWSAYIWLLLGIQVIWAHQPGTTELYIVAQHQVFCSESKDVAAGCPTNTALQFIVVNDCITDSLEINIALDLYQDGVIDADNQVIDEHGNNTLLTKFNATITNSFPEFTIAGGSFPIGEHVFDVQVRDACGGSARQQITFSVIDCLAPVITSVQPATVKLLPITPKRDMDNDGVTDEGAIQLRVRDFVNPADYESCGGVVKAAIYASNDPNLSRVDFAPNPVDSALVLTCQDFQPFGNSDIFFGIAPVRIYLIEIPNSLNDTVQNFAYTETYILAERDENIPCTSLSSAMISGTIRMGNGEPLPGVNLTLLGQSYTFGTTNNDGLYELHSITTNMPCTLTPAYAGNCVNGVSTYDIILIRKHILGVAPLDNPYKMIAADVNDSKTITTLDILQIRKVILGVDNCFSNNKSWRFVPANYQFPHVDNPWSEVFPEYISMNSLTADVTNADFVAIKMGDVNFSANASGSSSTSVEDRSAKDLFYMKVNNELLKAGNTYTIDLRAPDLTNLQGLQAALAFDKDAVELVNWEGGVMQTENVGLSFISQGLLLMSWDNPIFNTHAAQQERVLSFVLQAKKNVELKDVLTIADQVVKAEAYDQTGDLQGIALQFEEEKTSTFEVDQNFPNPFVGETIINFYLPKASNITLLVQDITGRTVWQQKAHYPIGNHQITLNSNSLPKGILLYTIQSDTGCATKKMIVGE